MRFRSAHSVYRGGVPTTGRGKGPQAERRQTCSRQTGTGYRISPFWALLKLSSSRTTYRSQAWKIEGDTKFLRQRLPRGSALPISDFSTPLDNFLGFSGPVILFHDHVERVLPSAVRGVQHHYLH